MKKTYILAAVVGGLFLLSRMPKAKQTTQKQTPQSQEIFYGEQNGWRYFTDGTAIDPEGNYYSGGQLIYRAS